MAFTLDQSERSALLQHVADLSFNQPQKQVLIRLFLRLLIQGETDRFSFLIELDKDSKVFYNVGILEHFLLEGEWNKAEEYLLKFFSPRCKFFKTLDSCRENDMLENVDEIITLIGDEVYCETDRIIGEIGLSESVLAGIPNIPLISLVDAVKECNVGPSQVPLSVIRSLMNDETALMKMVEDAQATSTSKREAADLLLQKSDLAKYKAMMALQIAEAAEGPGSSAQDAEHLEK